SRGSRLSRQCGSMRCFRGRSCTQFRVPRNGDRPWPISPLELRLHIPCGGTGSLTPTNFRALAKGRIDGAVEVDKTHLARKLAARLFLDCPESEAEQSPMTGIAQKARPGFLFGRGLTENKLGHGGLGPHRCESREIFLAMAAQDEPR